MKQQVTGYLLLAALALAGVASASIENGEPVKVTHRNSGPRYDFDDAERARIPPREPDSSNNVEWSNFNKQVAPALAQQQQQQQQQEAGNEGPTIEKISVHRRIFLIPVQNIPDDSIWSTGPAARGRQPEEEGDQQAASGAEARMPNMFAGWPFVMRPPPQTTSQQHHHRHLFGADEASRPARQPETGDQSAAASGGEREAPPTSMERPMRPLLDPMQMMIELMKHALSGGGVGQTGVEPTSSNFFGTDLNREPSNSRLPAGGDLEKSGSESESKPATSRNETREDIVEIEGKKFLRKTIVNHHVGENIVFMTRRLIFVPLNETETNNATEAISSTQATPQLMATNLNAAKPEQEAATTSIPLTSSSSSSISEIPVSTTQSAQPSTTVVVDNPDATSPPTNTKEDTTAKDSWVERVSEAVERVAERMVESAERAAAASSSSSTTSTTTTAKPEAVGVEN